MSIYAYVGLPRSGKSYNAVANVILPALREGRRVVTNVPVYKDKVMGMDGVCGELVVFPVLEVAQDPELIRKYVLPGDVLVLDEVWRLWPAGLKAIDTPECYKSLLAEHGHMVDAKGRACHIVLVVQDLANIAVFARRLVEQTFLHTKLGHLGMEGRYRVDIYQASMTGVIGPAKQRIREIFGQYTKEVWELYKSHTLSESKVDGANEKSIDRRGNVLRRGFFVIGIPLALAVGVFCVWYLNREGNRMMHPQAKGVPSAIHPGYVDSVHEPARSGPLGSFAGALPSRPRYHLVGYIEVPGSPERSKALFAGESGAKVTRSMTHCRFVDNDYLECEIDGEWYGIAGASLAAHEPDAVPVSMPAGGAAHLPIPAAKAALLSVAKQAARPGEDILTESPPIKLPGDALVSSAGVGAYDPAPLEVDPVSGVVAFARARPWVRR